MFWLPFSLALTHTSWSPLSASLTNSQGAAAQNNSVHRFTEGSFFSIPVVRVPIAAEHRAVVGGEHALVAVGTPDVPQLDVSILKRRSKRKIILHAELNISDTLGLAWMRGERSNAGLTCWMSLRLFLIWFG